VDSLFSCPEDGCIKTFESINNLQKHPDVGRHLIKLERKPVYDKVIKKWAETCKAVGRGYIQSEVGATTAAESATFEPSMVEGWALRKGKKSVRFLENVSSFLHDVFIQGEETGIKANAGDVASKMKNLRLANGNKLFSKEEWLSTEQVARYFRRLSALNKSGVLKRHIVSAPDGDEEDDDEEDYVAEAEAKDTITRTLKSKGFTWIAMTRQAFL